jgi:hypothetical protein
VGRCGSAENTFRRACVRAISALAAEKVGMEIYEAAKVAV